jgi:hypothetical protein
LHLEPAGPGLDIWGILISSARLGGNSWFCPGAKGREGLGADSRPGCPKPCERKVLFSYRAPGVDLNLVLLCCDLNMHKHETKWQHMLTALRRL